MTESWCVFKGRKPSMEKRYGWKPWNLDENPIHYEGDWAMEQFAHRSCEHPSLESNKKTRHAYKSVYWITTLTVIIKQLLECLKNKTPSYHRFFFTHSNDFRCKVEQNLTQYSSVASLLNNFLIILPEYIKIAHLSTSIKNTDFT